MLHILIALFVQCLIAVATGNWWIGAAAAAGFFVGREHAQAEYRAIEHFYGGFRRNMPWWGGFARRAWSRKSLADFLLPLWAVCIAATIMTGRT